VPLEPEEDARFESWYRAEQPRLVASLAIAAADADLAADVVADAFASAYERWARVADMDSPTGWVRTVALNRLRRRLRRAALERRILRRTGEQADAPGPSAHPELWNAVWALPRRQREVVSLRIVLDLSQEDTAKLLGMRPGTVSATLVAARNGLSRALSGEVASR
jgi:RNA polymerase sigma factor (sigma-70 family)